MAAGLAKWLNFIFVSQNIVFFHVSIYKAGKARFKSDTLAGKIACVVKSDG